MADTPSLERTTVMSLPQPPSSIKVQISSGSILFVPEPFDLSSAIRAFEREAPMLNEVGRRVRAHLRQTLLRQSIR